MEYYNTIAQKAVAEYKDRGSKFIAYAFPVVSADECKQQLSILKKEHPKAAHHCFAYRIGIDGNNFRSSDDGEPAGTAGKPILGQIHSKELTDICIVVVRYFGGTLLGVPGLINAYKTAATLVLQVVPVLQKSIEIKYKLHFDYTQQNEVLTIIKQYNCTILAQEMQLFCDITIGIPISRLQEVLYKLNEIKQLEMHQLK
ncbi:MAG: YigZ family protein [Bacteroidetes bacterium]|nr:YigZ family protein [Bacteroidota bacterium]MBS1756875.1 YigZ family protein [Bacteroidota bacterium]